MNPPSPILAIRNLFLTINNQRILKNCTFGVNEAETVVILGPSGSGKSTLLRCINLLHRADAGEILFQGQDLMARDMSETLVRRMIGMVFQDYRLFEHINAYENLLLSPRTIGGGCLAAAKTQAVRFLDSVGLADKAERYPHELSGGQQQRIAIARALVMEPDLLLFDEPTSALDPESIEVLQALFQSDSLSRMTKIIVTHDVAFASRIADRILFMERGEIVVDTPVSDVFSNNVNPRLRQFLLHALPHQGGAGFLINS